MTPAGVVTDAATVAVPREPLPADRVLKGSPSAGLVELGAIGAVEIGVWEHTPGTSTAVEADEVFVVLSGRATVSFSDSDLDPVSLVPGSVVRLTAGMRTTWTVHETLRKVYVAG